MTVPRVVFDCNVFLQGAGRPTGPARACFRLVDESRVVLCISPEVLTEVRDVLSRPVLRRRFSLLTPEWAEEFVRNAEGKALVLAEVPTAFHYPRDPKDEPYLNLAVAAGAQYLVSRDNDLLDLMKDDNPDGQALRQLSPQLRILAPEALLSVLAPKEPPPTGSA